MASTVLIDVGNTEAKWWLQHNDIVVAEGRCEAEPEALAASLAAQSVAAERGAIASVAALAADDDFVAAIAQATGVRPLICRADARCLGVLNGYPAPETLGVDRWLGMLGAWRPDGGPVCVVDAGTAITVDLVAATGKHEGGYILPGPLLMQEALVSRTQRIRVTASAEPRLTPGLSTDQCVAAGAWLAALGALQGIASRYPEHRRLVCGGHAQALLSLGLTAEWRPQLIREGLSRWLAAQSD